MRHRRADELPRLRSLELANDGLRVVVFPELGGKIASLVSRRTGREWLWRNPHLPYRRAAPGDSYVALHDTGGIDECFPTVAPSESLPDHGELWSRAWTIEERGGDRVALSVLGPRESYRFRRTLHLPRAAARLELAYELESHSDRELPFVWCLHALFAIEPGMQVELPDATPIRVPDPQSAGFTPSATKRFAGPLSRGGVALRTADGRESLRLRFDPAEVPFVGLWQNYAGWSGADTPPYFNLAIEPSIGDRDGLDDARARGTAGILAPRARRAWRIALELEP
jgi:hypothetical protein